MTNEDSLRRYTQEEVRDLVLQALKVREEINKGNEAYCLQMSATLQGSYPDYKRHYEEAQEAKKKLPAGLTELIRLKSSILDVPERK